MAGSTDKYLRSTSVPPYSILCTILIVNTELTGFPTSPLRNVCMYCTVLYTSKVTLVTLAESRVLNDVDPLSVFDSFSLAKTNES